MSSQIVSELRVHSGSRKEVRKSAFTSSSSASKKPSDAIWFSSAIVREIFAATASLSESDADMQKWSLSARYQLFDTSAILPIFPKRWFKALTSSFIRLA